MTIVVLWYGEKSDELRCAADTRISRGASTATDNGPKILPVPVLCHGHVHGQDWRPYNSNSFGFAFSGSTLAAISTHALATACTQNLAATRGAEKPISVEGVAKLFQVIGNHYIVDMSSRLGATDSQSTYFFEGMIFGFCPIANRYKAFSIAPSLESGTFQMQFAEIPIVPDLCYAIGSGTAGFLKLNEELSKSHPDPGVMTTLAEMVRREVQPDVGGHLQIGICTRTGFSAHPFINLGDGPGKRFLSFLGWDVSSATEALDGFRIGYRAVSTF